MWLWIKRIIDHNKGSKRFLHCLQMRERYEECYEKGEKLHRQNHS